MDDLHQVHEPDAEQLAAVRALLDAAFEGEFGEDDWTHALGGLHVMLMRAGKLLAHAAVVPRTLYYDGRPLRTGYVEGVAVHPSHQRRGCGTRVMTSATEHVLETYELGGLSDGSGFPGFYRRHGWLPWLGPTSVATAQGMFRTADEDHFVRVLPTARSGDLSLRAPLACDWRPGDVW
ncbi:aminoglycoside 2'-N-acetyltransferase I [Saccharopolyspora lacisalsi]|uniref:Aminoglycoside 2'-N-acetyltransferase I n=1 Tax=Halosaccharopolyspora lacisalsi TaxID=1000566 RepID=A0A839E0H3_9PSEU|nr:GNAT family N-acetyltransferase [Halosaccharopolyspora lacisalsi]MBA8825247.1 aminoglycoside 2'-N-acetyltransferase I [Halosaccharopolyspora lacisalsi]